MGFLTLLLIAVGLSMDAFAVALCKGLVMKKLSMKNGAIIALFFGLFQALMPLIGWLLGKQFESYITNFDHWVSFALLLFIGSKMALESFKKEDYCPDDADKLYIKGLLVMAVATSIDALAVGITFVFLQTAVLPAVFLVGVTTFFLSLLGVYIGNRFGAKHRSRAELAGGIVLILIGLKILLEHLGVL